MNIFSSFISKFKGVNKSVGNYNINIHAVDGKSFSELCRRNPDKIIEPLLKRPFVRITNNSKVEVVCKNGLEALIPVDDINTYISNCKYYIYFLNKE